MKQSLSEIRQLQKMAGILGTKVKPGIIRENEYKELKEENEYDVDNDQIETILKKIIAVYSKEDNKKEPAFVEMVKHLQAALTALAKRSGN